MADQGQQKHYFYVLLCGDGSLYAGYTTDLAKRLATHRAGKGAKYTRAAKRQPLTMIYAEYFDQKRPALQSEARFKQLNRAEKLAYLAQAQVNVHPSQALVLVKGLQNHLLVTTKEGDQTHATTEELST
ncbi:GIY-YIG nuclease family protein [Vaginisenegalia massiliensis]|uniref:GIY-YIG nuclease family protein n=1 Tax=Vaginisenegalia massiliensis TaxID=2058294 RepID=UPI000F51D281|nr:GIY-YIG nuclease family protein [Vaginisenegalia massiliensis]